MKNPIIAELRLIRDDNARRHDYDVESMAREWVVVEPWEKRKTVTLRGGRMVPAFPVRKLRKTPDIRLKCK